jgi:hypothetical protein
LSGKTCFLLFFPSSVICMHVMCTWVLLFLPLESCDACTGGV